MRRLSASNAVLLIILREPLSVKSLGKYVLDGLSGSRMPKYLYKAATSYEQK